MPDSLLFVALFISQYAGFAFLAICMKRHQRQIGFFPPEAKWPPKTTRLFATLLLLGSLWLAVYCGSAGFGVLLAVMCAGLSCIAVALTLTWRPHWLNPFIMLLATTLTIRKHLQPEEAGID